MYPGIQSIPGAYITIKQMKNMNMSKNMNKSMNLQHNALFLSHSTSQSNYLKLDV